MYNALLPAMMQWVRCDACQHVFTSGYWWTEAIALINSKVFDNQSVGWDMSKSRLVAAQMIDSVMAVTHVGLASHATWLDIGFGNGALLFTAVEYGYRGVGIDIRQPLVDDMRKVGIEAQCCTIENLPGESKFDVISMADVLEHCPFPGRTLSAARTRLARDGVLLLSMPNMGSPIWDYLDSKDDNPYWNEIEHYHNFSCERLYSLLKTCGFWPDSYRASRRYEACMEVIARGV